MTAGQLFTYNKYFGENQADLTIDKIKDIFVQISEERYEGYLSYSTVQEIISYFNSTKGRELGVVAGHIADAQVYSRYSLVEKDRHFYDIAADVYYLSTNGFVEVWRKDGSYFEAHGNNIKSSLGFYCVHNRKWYYAPEFTRIFDAISDECYCLEECEDILYHWSNDKYSITQESLSHKDISSFRKIKVYHSSSRPKWWKEKQGIGMELEMYSTHREGFIKTIPEDILAETDGSLCYNYGVELIGGPYTLEEYQSGKTPWQTVLSNENKKKFDLQGFDNEDTSSNQYGIHLSISRELFTSLHAAKFIIWFNQQSNLVKLVAQRTKIYEGKYGTYPDIKSIVTDTVDIDSYDVKERAFLKRKKNIKTKKYEPVSIDAKRLEVRVFASNIKWTRILKNIEFVQAAFDFTRNCSISVIAPPEGTTQFLTWLNQQANFYHLKAFLSEMKSYKLIETFGDESIETEKLLENHLFTLKSSSKKQ